MASTGKSAPTTLSGDKKRKRGSTDYYAVRKGINTGIYRSWSDAQKQVTGYPGAEYKKFALETDAQAFMNNNIPRAAAAAPSRSKKGGKFYGVQVGRAPGVYDNWDEVLRQTRGFPGAKQQKFGTREEAQAFAEGNSAFASTATSVKGDVGSEVSTVRKLKPGDNVLKKQKKNDGHPAVVMANGEIEPGTGPLPPDAEDGFDRNIVLRADTGHIEFKTEEELNARKKQPTGDITGPLVIYTDGAAPGNGKIGAVAGVGVYFGDGHKDNVSEWLGPGRQTNQRAELQGLKRAVDIAPINKAVEIRSDSSYSIKCVTEWSIKWVKNGWKSSIGKPVENRDIIEPILDRIYERQLAGADTKFKWVKGHASDPGNIAADQLAVEGAQKGVEILKSLARGKVEKEKRKEEVEANMSQAERDQLILLDMARDFEDDDEVGALLDRE